MRSPPAYSMDTIVWNCNRKKCFHWKQHWNRGIPYCLAIFLPVCSPLWYIGIVPWFHLINCIPALWFMQNWETQIITAYCGYQFCYTHVREERNKRDAPFCRECAGRRILVLCSLKACNHNENTQDQKEDWYPVTEKGTNTGTSVMNYIIPYDQSFLIESKHRIQ